MRPPLDVTDMPDEDAKDADRSDSPPPAPVTAKLTARRVTGDATLSCEVSSWSRRMDVADEVLDSDEAMPTAAAAPTFRGLLEATERGLPSFPCAARSFCVRCRLASMVANEADKSALRRWASAAECGFLCRWRW